MTANPRLRFYLLALAAVLVAGYLAALAGQAVCEPDALPGEMRWVWVQRFWQGFGLMAGAERVCFLGTATGLSALAIAGASGYAAVAVIALAVAWEAFGRPLRRAWYRARGGHAVLAGEPGEVGALAPKRSGTSFFLARNADMATALGRERPFAEVSNLKDRREAARRLTSLGAGRARLVAAATANDLTNAEIAERALDAGGKAELLVRLEQGSVRALKSDPLRREAEKRHRRLTVVSLRQMQAREALQLAMPGRYVLPGAPRVHIALAGAGPMMQDMAFLLSRQGYGLEVEPPLLSLMRTGQGDFGAGALERLVAAEAVQVHAVPADGESAVDIERAFTTIALSGPPLAALHCCEAEEGGALQLALRLERVLIDLKVAVPPIVVHGRGREDAGETGMIRVAREHDLARARRHARRIDKRAMAFHEAYLAGQRQAAGEAFGQLPAERDWRTLPEGARDDNRFAADHIDYKLARVGLTVTAEGEDAALTPAEIEDMARYEHARWMASKSLSGFRYGEKRDNRLMLHPDMLPYDSLDADAQRKDRDQVATIPAQLASGGEHVARLEPHVLHAKAGGGATIDALAGRAAGAMRPLVAVSIESEDGLALAERAIAAKLALEAAVTAAPEHAFAEPSQRRRAAAILRKAWRIRVVPEGEEPGAALAAAHGLPVGADGGSR